MDLVGVPLVLAQEPPQPPGPQPANPMEFLFPLVFVFIFFYFFLIRPQRREQQEKEKMLEALQKNDRVVTSGGMFGTITNIKGDEVTLRIDDQAKVKVRMLKSAIARVVTSTGESQEAKKS